ncbi:MAG: carboxypeptidase regulatory-like domain-containing protein [Thermoanaerobaculia bacterium]
MPTRTVRGFICLAAVIFLSAETSRAQEEDLTGRVVDGEGRPLAGVEIWRPMESSAPAVAAVSGPDGLFTVPAAGIYPLSACPPGWLPDESPSPAPREPGVFEIRLRPAARIAGRVVDGQGEPVEGVQIEAWLAGKTFGCAVHVQSGCPGPADRRTGYSDADGRFAFESLEPGWFEVSAQDALPKVARRLGEAGTSAEEIELVLSERLVPLEGRVTDIAGLTPRQFVSLELEGGPQESSARARADEQGRFQIRDVAPGTWTLLATDNLGRTLERRVQVEEGRKITLEELRFPPLPAVRGRVLDPEGRPVVDASLSFEQAEGLRAWAGTDAEGRFTAHLVDGTWTLKAEQPGFGPAATTVTLDGAPVDVADLRLVRGVAVSGSITGLAPGEVPFIQATSEDGAWTRGARANLDATYLIPALWPGTWIVTIKLDERESSTRVRILPNDEAVRIDLVFEADPE